MTMSEIDKAREKLDDKRAEYRRARERLEKVQEVDIDLLREDTLFETKEFWQGAVRKKEMARAGVRFAEENVLAALRAWWAQNCQESALESWTDRIIDGLTDKERDLLWKRAMKRWDE